MHAARYFVVDDQQKQAARYGQQDKLAILHKGILRS